MRNCAAEFDKAFRSLNHSHQPWKVWSDFVESAALALVQCAKFEKDPKIEERYLAIAAQYKPEEWRRMPELLGLVVELMEENPGRDVLGSAFMRHELGNHWAGQFFTPSEVSLTMARMLVGDGAHLKELIETRRFVRLMEPACGAGGMVLAFAQAMREAGFNPQEVLHSTAIDIAPTCAHMAHVQMTLTGLPGVVHVGDSLSNEMRETWHTPWHWKGLWNWRIAPKDADEVHPPRVLVEHGKGAAQLRLW